VIDSSALGVAQLELAHAVGESIFCVRGGDAAVLKLLWDFLLRFRPVPWSLFEDDDKDISVLWVTQPAVIFFVYYTHV